MLAKFQILILCCLLLTETEAMAVKSLPEMRADFLRAEKLIRTDQDAEYFKLADSLTDYALYPYLHYQWLKKISIKIRR
nr:hypothetical protein [Methylomarinum sp. Ch1-1]MDP4520942.1 hypothetical protein [Methylomarinum sp. Ch1-1]